MKKLILNLVGRLLLAVMATAIATSAYAGEIRHKLTLDPTAIKLDTVASPDGTPYIMVNAQDANYYAEPSAPFMPCVVINFLVPQYSKNFSASLDNCTTASPLTSTISIATGKDIAEWGEDDIMTSEATTSFEGTNNTWILRDYIVNGSNHVVSVAVPIGTIDSSFHKFTPYASLDISVNYEECTADEVDYTLIDSKPSEWDVDVRSLVVNPVTTYNLSSSVTESNGPIERLSPSFYYILVPRKLRPSVERLAYWKAQKGHVVTIKNVEDIMVNSDYSYIWDEGAFDKESRIRNWLRLEYNLVGKFQLLIVGDYRTSAPIRKFRDSHSNKKESYGWYDGENFVPTDAYFSDMTTKFKLDSIVDGKYYGYISDQQYSPELHVGRLLSYKPEHLETYTDKVLNYEINPGLGKPDYLENGFVNRQYMFGTSRSLFDRIPDFKNLITLNDTKGGLVFNDCEPTGQDVIDGMKNCGMISLQGHGSPVTICTSGDRQSSDDWKQNRYIQAVSSYTTEETRHPNPEVKNGLDNMNNAGKPAVLYTFSCTSTPFDNIRFEGDVYRNVPFDMGSSFTVAGDYGGVAYIGNTRVGWLPFQNTMETDFGTRINGGENIGSAFVNSSLAIAYRHQQFTRSLIGDPDLNIWLGIPSKLDISVSYNTGMLILSGTDLKGAKVTIYDGGQKSYMFRIHETSSASIPVNQLGFGENDVFIVSVFKDGYYPKITLCASETSIVSSSKQFFVSDTSLVNENGASRCSVTGNLTLNCIGNLRCENMFNVESGGEITVKAEGCVKLNGERFCSGARGSISASEVVLGPGFAVEKGGVLNFSNNR